MSLHRCAATHGCIQKAKNLLKFAGQYLEDYGENPAAIIDAAYMSEEASDLDDATPEDRQRWKTDIERAARITEADREEGNAKVLEVVRPACRPAKVC